MSIYKQTRELLQDRGVHPKKRLGQNFLIDRTVFDTIVESTELLPDDVILEIGAGTGILTRELAKSSGMVIAVELDKGLFEVLESACEDVSNVVMIHADILKLNLVSFLGEFISAQDQKIKIIGNLPYYITTPILMKILDESSELPISLILVMVQKEVGVRMTANPGGKEYGALSVAIAYRCHADIVRRISAGSFYPKPKVDSVLIRLRLRDKPPVKVEDEKLFFRVVRSAFQYRRKTLRNALSTAGFAVNIVDQAIQSLGFDVKRRGETLYIEEFAELANTILKVTEV